uniref:Uncharacterized protein n=1 Tax=Dictyoglomus turgidum TaxID=513050 RepID=A0A7C3SNH8_9BACT
MKLTEKEIEKIKLDALIERRLREIQTIANLEVEVKYFEKLRLLPQVDSKKVEEEISIKKAEIEVHQEIIKILDEVINKNG